MSEIVEKLLREFAGEGKRFIKTKALAALVSLLKGFRALVMLQYVIMTFCFLSAMSLFSTGYFFLNPASPPYLLFKINFPSLSFVYAVSVFLCSSLVLFLSTRQSFWHKVLGIDRALADEPVAHDSVGSMSSSELRELIDETIDRKVIVLRKERQKRSTSKPVKSRRA